MEMGAKEWIELVAVATIPIGLIGLYIHRIWLDIAMGVRAIQFAALIMVLPIILILALEGILERSAVGALLGGLIGYLFTHIGTYDQRKTRKKSDDA